MEIETKPSLIVSSPQHVTIIQLSLKQLSWLDNLECDRFVINRLIEIVQMITPRTVNLSSSRSNGNSTSTVNCDLRSEIILALPGIASDAIHPVVAEMLCRIAKETDGEKSLPAILQTFSFLRIPEKQAEEARALCMTALRTAPFHLLPPIVDYLFTNSSAGLLGLRDDAKKKKAYGLFDEILMNINLCVFGRERERALEKERGYEGGEKSIVWLKAAEREGNTLIPLIETALSPLHSTALNDNYEAVGLWHRC
ncbi:uncharacterized protein MONOS_18432 [Monocercomonoides exilis]|uniref:uncharacterized protein n=1 Tax=Monocercomonoides exilis TaxID=2049356 RepID=UPI003559D85F|nr:hypothetical protein MONOS_18432 [Monocercomonoides exilis]